MFCKDPAYAEICLAQRLTNKTADWRLAKYPDMIAATTVIMSQSAERSRQ